MLLGFRYYSVLYVFFLSLLMLGFRFKVFYVLFSIALYVFFLISVYTFLNMCCYSCVFNKPITISNACSMLNN